MFDIKQYPQALAVSQSASLSPDDYQRLYRQSVEAPDTFWGRTGQTPGLDQTLVERAAMRPEDQARPAGSMAAS
jgi:acetyl-coenzyme A synthetase (EC 6.2.1.1)